jgi:hypothetical protein
MVVVIGALTIAFIAVLLFGLVTGRIAWRQTGCCALPAERDWRMRDAMQPDDVAREV